MATDVTTVQWAPKYRTPHNYNYMEHPGETSDKPSKTIPDQSMSIKEILDRYRRGLPVTAGKVPIWEEDGDNPITPPEWDQMDLSEKDEYMREQARKLAEFRNKQRKDADAKAIEEKKKKFFEEFQAMKDQEEKQRQSRQSSDQDK